MTKQNSWKFCKEHPAKAKPFDILLAMIDKQIENTKLTIRHIKQ
jgi:hypothetical protein